jgi:hypothetical protein
MTDPNPTAPAPTGDQPTWTVDEDTGKAWWGPDKFGAYTDIEGAVYAGTSEARRAYAALVDAVHRSQLLDTALDIIAHCYGPDGNDWPDYKRGEWVNVFTDERKAMDDPDAVRAVRALAERRHRD